MQKNFEKRIIYVLKELKEQKQKIYSFKDMTNYSSTIRIDL